MFKHDDPHVFGGIPFTARQVPRKLRWFQDRGLIRQLVKGVYVDVRIHDSPALRYAALELVVPPGATVYGRTAAWLHGIGTTALGPEELLHPEWTHRPLGDVVEIGELKATDPITTAVALAMQLPRPFALSAVDAFLYSGRADRWALRAASAAHEGQRGYRQSQEILRYADRRAASPGESWLRLRLLDAGFPRPELQVSVEGQGRTYRLDLGYPDNPIDGRRLGLEYDSDAWHSTDSQQHRDEARRATLGSLGWHIMPVRRTDLWGSYPALELAVGGFLCQQPRLPRRW
ncbi:hypothetical protein HPO96_36220 [Kribbella sandramycini]|uniref:Restriction endonuclease type II-like domain-containing protein n=1 Tax=Kribbella sandramycini TaxID=60450 RepID=A0A7Y4L7B4_9ACTN|nr:hypothetical protein [Kribbella sandramycini]MBB6570171.1 hypothetical protein [Kribbella sandramycini]NOL45704.1 hypothetical protein [Kribbella sandramycini]